MEIVPSVHVIPGNIVNEYLIVEPEGLTLIDTGMPRGEKKIINYIEGLGRSPGDLRRIIITHADGDHVGSLAALKAATGARVYASAPEAQAIAAGRSSRPLNVHGVQAMLVSLFSPLLKARPTDVDEVLADQQMLPILGGLCVIETPGHTPGHISLFANKPGILFVGDSLVSANDGLRGSSGANTWDQVRADESVRRQAALGARIVCPGHGSIVRDPQFPQV